MSKCNNCTGKCTCKREKTCACPVPNLTSSCVEYNGEKLQCSGIEIGGSINSIFRKLDKFICDRFDYFTATIGGLLNIGNGAKVYKGVGNTGQSQIRTFESSDSSVIIEEKEFTIDLKADTANLKSVGDGNPIYLGQNMIGEKEISSIKNVNVVNEYVDVPVKVYKGFNPETKNHEMRTITNTDGTLEVIERADAVVINTKLNSLNDSSFHVDKDYKGETENGTPQQPYKTLDAAIQAYIGNGTIGSPQYIGRAIRVVGSGTHNFTNHLAIADLVLIIESQATINYIGTEQYPIDFRILQSDIGGAGNQNKYINIKITGDGRFESDRGIAYVNGGISTGGRIEENKRKDINILTIDGSIYFYSRYNKSLFKREKDLDDNWWTYKGKQVMFYFGDDGITNPIFVCDGLKSEISFNKISTIESYSNVLIEARNNAIVNAIQELITINSQDVYAVGTKELIGINNGFSGLIPKNGLCMVKISTGAKVNFGKGINNRGEGMSKFESIYSIEGVDSKLTVSNDNTTNGGSDVKNYIKVIGQYMPKIGLYKNNITKELEANGTFIYAPDLLGVLFEGTTSDSLKVMDNIFNFNYNSNKISLTSNNTRTVTNYFKHNKVTSMVNLTQVQIDNNEKSLPVGTIVYNTTEDKIDVIKTA